MNYLVAIAINCITIPIWAIIMPTPLDLYVVALVNGLAIGWFIGTNFDNNLNLRGKQGRAR